MYLEQIIAKKKQKKSSIDRRAALKRAEQQIVSCGPTRSFMQALRQPHRALGVIAEVKKASPSKGIIRPSFDPLAIVRAYVDAHVDALSILTEEDFFLGSPAVLSHVREHVTLPLLRKDFTLEPLDVYEARAMGADAVLLIAAVLPRETMVSLMRHAQEVQLEVLVEVHDETELAHAVEMGAQMVGINNRNLHTFEVDLAYTERLAAHIPPDRLIVSESGIRLRTEVQRVQEAGAHAILVGEQFMRHADVAQAVIDLVGAAR